MESEAPDVSAAAASVDLLLSPHAVKLQKVYRSYRTRRRLADSAVVAEELWWQAIDYARLNRSTISFFSKPESAVSKWSRVGSNASKVGKGLSKDDKALKLAFEHWIEAIDPRHRYGHNLHVYYEEWCKSDAGQPFFYWLDIGDGRNMEVSGYPRSILGEQVVKYLGPQEREEYEYEPIEGKIMHRQTGKLLDTRVGSEKAKWIFVLSTSNQLYAGQKEKGRFHHSSFLAGGATMAAGRLVVENGVLKSLWAYSGHYRPSAENLDNFLGFLRKNGIDPNDIQIHSWSDSNYDEGSRKCPEVESTDVQRIVKPAKIEVPPKMHRPMIKVPEIKELSLVTLSGGIQSPRPSVSRNAILRRMESKGKVRSYELGHKITSKWCSGVGPRIGCVADYPVEVRVQALDFVNLSPRIPTPLSSRRFSSPLVPTSSLAAASCN